MTYQRFVYWFNYLFFIRKVELKLEILGSLRVRFGQAGSFHTKSMKLLLVKRSFSCVSMFLIFEKREVFVLYLVYWALYEYQLNAQNCWGKKCLFSKIFSLLRQRKLFQKYHTYFKNMYVVPQKRSMDDLKVTT